jgi:hypothetical protein
MGIGKMNKMTVPDGIGKMARNRFGIGKMYSDNMYDDKRTNPKVAEEDMEK